jgi:glycosyltransferase involved in cell wall biosynthesis
VRLLGPIEHARVPELLAAADIAIEPAPCGAFNDRSTMAKVPEYLAAGLPVVAYDLPETRVTAGAAAVYARCGDQAGFARAVAGLAADPDRRRELAERALQRARQLVWERSEAALVEAYRGLER